LENVVKRVWEKSNAHCRFRERRLIHAKQIRKRLMLKPALDRQTRQFSTVTEYRVSCFGALFSGWISQIQNVLSQLRI
jgi:hypothetical protein